MPAEVAKMIKERRLFGYQPKALGTMVLFGLERYCLDIATVTADELLARVCEVLERRFALAQQIAVRRAEVQAVLQGWSCLLQE